MVGGAALVGHGTASNAEERLAAADTPTTGAEAGDIRPTSLSISAPTGEDFLARFRIGPKHWLSIVQAAAAAHNLPADFLAAVLKQESAFNPSSVSRVGALGIAQFMPGTAVRMKLRDPFDAEEAIPASARYLASLRSRFGNLGLAAAAYNAGPGRVSAWLSRGGKLPKETVDYVQAVTGRSAESWRGGPLLSSATPDAIVQTKPHNVRSQPASRRKARKDVAFCQKVGTACLELPTY
jgi:soluble lytic murein transglycosylase-like protein